MADTPRSTEGQNRFYQCGNIERFIFKISLLAASLYIAMDTQEAIVVSSPTDLDPASKEETLATLVADVSRLLQNANYEVVWERFIARSFDDLAPQYEATTGVPINSDLKKRTSKNVASALKKLSSYGLDKNLQNLRDAENLLRDVVDALELVGGSAAGLDAAYLLLYFSVLNRLISVSKDSEDLRATRFQFAKIKADTLSANLDEAIALRRAQVTQVQTGLGQAVQDTWAYRSTYRFSDGATNPIRIETFDHAGWSDVQNRDAALEARTEYLDALSGAFAYIRESVRIVRLQARYYDDGDAIWIGFPSVAGIRYMTACDYRERDKAYHVRFQDTLPDDWTNFRVKISETGLLSLSFSGIYLAACDVRLSDMSYEAWFQCHDAPCENYSFFSMDIAPLKKMIMLSFSNIYLAACDVRGPDTTYEARFQCTGAPCEGFSYFTTKIR